MFQVKEATGCAHNKALLMKEQNKFHIEDFGAGVDKTPVENTDAINRAITKAAEQGGTVVIPSGEYKVYTIYLKSKVNLFLSKGSILRAAKTDIKNSYELQVGEGGNYGEPEVNLYVGLQDHGHTYFANSLIYGADLEDVMIYGPGLIDGSALNQEGELDNVLMGGDPEEPVRRAENGHRGEWFGNKAIALVRCENVSMCDFSIVAGGHFAIIAICVKNMYVDHILVDTNRDAFDVDCCQNVTIRNSTFNSLTDDGIVMKASYGGGIFMPLKNVLIEDCKVSGYDMGSVYAGTYTKDKLIATDRCGPTARVKLGTESTCGYDCVTVRRVTFKRSRGFALEAVDGSDLSNIIFEDSTLEEVSSSPIFIKVGDRGRFPVTGNSAEDSLYSNDNTNIRLDNKNFILPAKDKYTSYAAKRYLPSNDRNTKVTVDGHSFFHIVNQDEPTRLNPANYHYEDGKYYGLEYKEATKSYVIDYTKVIEEEELCHYANASGSKSIAKVYNIVIRNITATNVDPRYPIEIMGLVGSRIKNVYLENISVSYRGGLDLSHAVEQRQLNTNWEFTLNGKKKPSIQSLPWLVNTFFLKNEGLLPRVQWDSMKNKWVDAPFNIPELPEVYPEPSNWGILPAYGLYARHVENLHMENLKLEYMVEDGRYPIVLDDIEKGSVSNIHSTHKDDTEEVVIVIQLYKRPAGFEYVKNHKYSTTSVNNVTIDQKLSMKTVVVDAPAPGTPKDNYYGYETVAIPETGYTYSCKTIDLPLPQTVFRPFFYEVGDKYVKAGETLTFQVIARQPAYETSLLETDGKIYNESLAAKDYTVQGIPSPMKLEAVGLPEQASFHTSVFEPGKPCVFEWTPTKDHIRDEGYHITFIADDGLIPVRMETTIYVK